MPDAPDFETMLSTLPDLAHRIWCERIAGPSALDAVLVEAGLPGVDFRGGPYGRFDWPLAGVEDEVSAERRLRSAITRRVGKPAGGDKHWDLGSFEFSLRLSRGRLRGSFNVQYSLADIRDAARDWLDGMAGREWLLRHRFADPANLEPNEHGLLPKPDWTTGRPMARLGDGGASASLFHDPAARPPGVKAKSDDDAYELAIAYLREALGDPDDPDTRFSSPKWTRGDRYFGYRRMSSRSRSVEFRER